jgi:hypothetical protein
MASYGMAKSQSKSWRYHDHARLAQLHTPKTRLIATALAWLQRSMENATVQASKLILQKPSVSRCYADVTAKSVAWYPLG